MAIRRKITNIDHLPELHAQQLLLLHAQLTFDIIYKTGHLTIIKVQKIEEKIDRCRFCHFLGDQNVDILLCFWNF